MDNPFAPKPRKRGEISPARNDFQSELDAKMKDRRRRGLSADIPSSDEELPSDDELMAKFNMTSKGRKSPYSQGSTGSRRSPLDDIFNKRNSPSGFRESPVENGLGGNSDLMMTLKKPWQPPPNKKGTSSGRGRNFGALDEELSPRTKENKPWKPPEMRKTSLAELESGKPDRKSPALKGRSGTPTALDSLENTPRTTPRSSQPAPTLRELRRRQYSMDIPEREHMSTEKQRPIPKPRRHSPGQKSHDTLDGGFQRYRREDEANRTSPYLGRKSPYDDRSASPKNVFGKREDDPVQALFGKRGSPYSEDPETFHGDRAQSSYGKRGTANKEQDARKSPYYDDSSKYTDRKSSSYGDKKTSFFDDRNSPYLDDRKNTRDGRKTDKKEGHKTPPPDRRSGRKTPSKDDVKTRQAKSPSVDGRRTPSGQAKSPGVDGRRTPSGKDRSSPSSDRGESRRSSVLDFLTGGPSQEENKSKTNKKTTKKKTSYLNSSDSEDDDHHRSDAVPKVKAGQRSAYRDDYRHDDKSPFGERSRGQSPYSDKHGRQSSSYRDDREDMRPTLKKKYRDDADNDDMFPKPMPRSRGERGAKEEDRGRSRHRKSPERGRDSSLCEEVEKDPSIRPQPIPQKEKEKKSSAQRQEKKLLEEVIDSVAGDNERTMRFIEPDSEQKKEIQDTGVKHKHKPKPRYAKPEIESSSRQATPSFDSTQNIKDVIYQNWYKERQEKSKQRLKEQKQKEKEEEEKKKKAKEDRDTESKLSFQAWAENKKPAYKEKAKLKMKEAEKEHEEKQKQQEKLKDSELSYRKWKENKDAMLREKQRKSENENRKVREAEIDKQRNKEKSSDSAYKGWKGKKDDLLKTKAEDADREKKEEEKEKVEEQRRKLREARRQYEKWLDKKEDQDQKRMRSARSRESLKDTQPPWSPAGNRIIQAGY